MDYVAAAIALLLTFNLVFAYAVYRRYSLYSRPTVKTVGGIEVIVEDADEYDQIRNEIRTLQSSIVDMEDLITKWSHIKQISPKGDTTADKQIFQLQGHIAKARLSIKEAEELLPKV